ncbi:hypothetical protein [uncultured Mediterranean phage uvMED]|nr:hypothetical protein [uncultured Mediterranean phage uvMED]
MNIYKLQYDTKTQGDADLLSKGVYEIVSEEGVSQDVYTNGTQAIVYMGSMVDIPATYDDEGNELTPAIYYDGVFYDLMTTQEYDFGANELFPTNNVHSFLGMTNRNEIEEELDNINWTEDTTI